VLFISLILFFPSIIRFFYYTYHCIFSLKLPLFKRPYCNRPTVAPSTIPPVSGATTAAPTSAASTAAAGGVTAPMPAAGWIAFWELALSQPCVTQPPLQINVTIRQAYVPYLLNIVPRIICLLKTSVHILERTLNRGFADNL
jgi:hypothetical protein